MKQITRSAICFSNFLDRCSAADLEHAVVIGALGYATEDSVDLASNRYHPLFPGDLSSELCHRSFQLSFLRWSGLHRRDQESMCFSGMERGRLDAITILRRCSHLCRRVPNLTPPVYWNPGERINHPRVELSSRAAPQFINRGFKCPSRIISTFGCHSVKGIGNRQDPRANQYLVG